MPSVLRRFPPVALLAAPLLALVPVAAAAEPTAPADHLIMTEIVVQTRFAGGQQIGSKYVAIVNPTAAPIDLSKVYLTDATFNSPPTYYYDVVRRGGLGGGGAAGDFHARFPDGAVIAPGDTIAVALRGSTEYFAAFQRLPDFELYEDGLAPDAVPELVPAFPGAIGRGLGSGGSNDPDLSATGETLVLYRWDPEAHLQGGNSDLVQDLDYVIWGTITSVRADKTGVSIDGPDPDDLPSTYLPDTPVGSQQPIAGSAHAFGGAFRRLSTDEGLEAQSGGNGITGHDETSERLASTWQVATDQRPPAAPAAWHPPAPILTAAAVAPAAPAAGQAATVTATVLAHDGVASVTLHWSADGQSYNEVACTPAGGNDWNGQIPGQAAGVEVLWYLQAMGTGGGRALRPVEAPVYRNAYVVQDAPPPPGDGPAKLLLTQVCVLGSPQEFIAVWNPNDEDVELEDYYLTDAIHAPGSQYYWRVVEPNPTQTTIGGGAFTDFHARFPAGAVIAAGDTIAVSIAGSDAFFASYGFLPHFELFEDGTGPDDVPDMRPVFPGSINGTTVPSLTNTSEIVVLYHWDGQSDLVTDVDVFFWGSGTSHRFSKTGVSIDGPDADTTPTAYRPDTPVASQRPFPSEHAFGEAYHRADAEEGLEIKTGGNGVDGHDETSENLDQTWQIAPAAPPRPGDAPPPGDGGGGVALEVPPRTFLPLLGETFPIRFRTLPGAQTLVRIFDLDGRLVMTVFDSRSDGAVATAPGQLTRRDWNGRDGQFELVPAGLYVVHLSVVTGSDGRQENRTAPVVVATRLER